MQWDFFAYRFSFLDRIKDAFLFFYGEIDNEDDFGLIDYLFPFAWFMIGVSNSLKDYVEIAKNWLAKILLGIFFLSVIITFFCEGIKFILAVLSTALVTILVVIPIHLIMLEKSNIFLNNIMNLQIKKLKLKNANLQDRVECYRISNSQHLDIKDREYEIVKLSEIISCVEDVLSFTSYPIYKTNLQGDSNLIYLALYSSYSLSNGSEELFIVIEINKKTHEILRELLKMDYFNFYDDLDIY